MDINEVKNKIVNKFKEAFDYDEYKVVLKDAFTFVNNN
ncbi:hypothetical protein ASZ90_004561 [hydrocarbon metagenome]|uniref:Uncharacterized protein n=1 Tax=hydrocarbon metagenome TaxID=938273 RepID=A0A0W8FXG0_9ZZZZ